MNTLSEKGLYFVAVKLLLEKDGDLLITKDIYDDGWDLPGGRIRKEEFGGDLKDVITRKINEELGSDVTYELGEPVVFFQHERLEESVGEQVRIFAIGYDAKFTGGEIQLGDHHEKFEWVPIATFDPEGYFTGGWKKGLQEYLEKKRSSE